MLDSVRLVSSEDVGGDEGMVQVLIGKQDEVNEDLGQFAKTVDQLQAQADVSWTNQNEWKSIVCEWLSVERIEASLS